MKLTPGNALADSSVNGVDAPTGTAWRMPWLVPGMIVIITLAHFVLDAVALQVQPLWPSLERHFVLTGKSIYWLIILWTASTSFTQLVFGYLSDRVRMDYLIWLAPGVAALCLGLIGLTDNAAIACVLMVLGGFAVASFHPEAATLAGNAMPEHRSRAVSIFVCGGFIGQTLGPLYGGSIAEGQGIPGLAWGILPGIAVTVALVIGFTFVRPINISAAVSRPRISTSARQWQLLSRILAIQSLRIVGGFGVPLALAFILDDRGFGAFYIGMQQAVFLGGIGIGGLICAVFTRQHHERRLLLWLPIAGVVPLCLLTFVQGGWMTVNVAVVALTVGVASPVMISYGQRILPSARRLASSMALGVSWGLGGTVATLSMSVVDRWPRPEVVFIAFALTSAGAGVLSLTLPKLQS